MCNAATEIELGTNVTSIGEYAFYGCKQIGKLNSDVTGELIVPDGVTSIGDYAFANMELITKVIVPDTVTEIGEGAFRGLNALEEITLPFVGETADASWEEGVFGHAFGYTKSYTNLGSISNTIKQYDDNYGYSYYYYIPQSIRKVTITNTKRIPSYAFKNCNFIEEITIPETITSIGSEAFYECAGLKRLNSETDGLFCIPAGVTEIKDYMFYMCNAATEIELGANVTSVGKYAFYSCKQIGKFNSDVTGELIVPDGVTNIGDYAFANTELITKVVVSDTVTKIGKTAFQGCTNLGNIYCEAVEKPKDWSSSWNTNCPAEIHWGYKE